MRGIHLPTRVSFLKCIASLCHGPFHQSPPLLYEMMLPPLMSVIGTDHFYKVNLLIPFHSGNRCSFYRGPIMGDPESTVPDLRFDRPKARASFLFFGFAILAQTMNHSRSNQSGVPLRI